jgi:uncharacterized protein (DUF1684 family)
VEETRAWQEGRSKRLTSETGWLTLIGLDWLKEGDNSFGTDTANAIVFPEGPKLAGVFQLAAGKVTLLPKEGLTIDGQPVTAPRPLTNDMEGTPEKVKLGNLVMTVIKRGERIGIRTRNPQSPVRTQFRGLEFFPPSEKHRVVARFVPSPSPRQIEIPTVLGTVDPLPVPGTLQFTLDGKDYELVPVLEDPASTELFVIFRDRTADDSTYQAGRFLYTELPKDGKVVVDFNRAYNPPCAFTDFATCPLPPKENVLPVRIEAGEKRYSGGHSP